MGLQVENVAENSTLSAEVEKKMKLDSFGNGKRRVPLKMGILTPLDSISLESSLRISGLIFSETDLSSGSTTTTSSTQVSASDPTGYNPKRKKIACVPPMLRPGVVLNLLEPIEEEEWQPNFPIESDDSPGNDAEESLAARSVALRPIYTDQENARDEYDCDNNSGNLPEVRRNGGLNT